MAIWENDFDVLQNGKCTININLKTSDGRQLARKIIQTQDVLIDPFRPGVMEKNGIGPDVLCKENPRLIYARLTGFGQYGSLAKRAGHDINYLAISGVLSMLRSQNSKPIPPVNILADFAGGGLICALGICLALLERHRSGCGQIIDASMCEGVAYISSWLFLSRSLPIWGNQTGQNILDGGSFFYDTYETKDGRFISVGALEPHFFDIFKQNLGLPELIQFPASEYQKNSAREAVKNAFKKKTRNEWSKVFENTDACVFPVVEWEEVAQYGHNKQRSSFQKFDNELVPVPSPLLSRTPGTLKSKRGNLTAVSVKGQVDNREISLSRFKAKI
ncbi:PREDICTED: alpha-methylacyl-CoA racemase isoform X2 [Rhagoletis zephyria]|uniref:alpha-methylacyl-CoA racemase isoform X2 n=1 Tax=Rhagoletis zephyria TaxID=28612 RepID=UPI00081136EE|nr:PREDICTED: alpha-methylacyl-CoA racemase isoform X2 [Rhagoletis zephyria]XP_036320569.1 alpha-methylacyl-CoA racemase isoform X2 [Rhagoletis pomonella]